MKRANDIRDSGTPAKFQRHPPIIPVTQAITGADAWSWCGVLKIIEKNILIEAAHKMYIRITISDKVPDIKTVPKNSHCTPVKIKVKSAPIRQSAAVFPRKSGKMEPLTDIALIMVPLIFSSHSHPLPKRRLIIIKRTKNPKDAAAYGGILTGP